MDERRNRSDMNAKDQEVWTKRLARVRRFWDLDEHEIGGSSEALADLFAATDMLATRIRSEAVASVVRRSYPLLNGQSLRDLVIEGRYSAVHDAVQRMVDLRSVQP